MVNTINQSFSEVYDIIMHLEKDLFNKIPKGFLKMIKQNRDLKYKVDIDYDKNINEQDLLQDTRAILSLIYRDYLCSPEEKIELIKKDKMELVREEEKRREKYNTDDIFKKKSIILEQVNNETANNINDLEDNMQIIKYEKSLFKRVINRIFKFLHIIN